MKRYTRQPWLLHPSRTRFVTFPCFGYACRPYRAIDGWGLAPLRIRSLVGCSPNGELSGTPDLRESTLAYPNTTKGAQPDNGACAGYQASTQLALVATEALAPR